jgi:hypothetical protein
MEAFEAFVALTMEHEGLVVSEAIKFPVPRQTKKTAYPEFQTHGFEVDLVGANADCLVLATVKSFFGSQGVVSGHVMGIQPDTRGAKLYALLNDELVRTTVIEKACERYNYRPDQVELRLYVGRFAGGKSRKHETVIREWAANQRVGRGPIRVIDVREVAATARKVAESTTYRDNPALVAIKVLGEAGMLTSLST